MSHWCYFATQVAFTFVVYLLWPVKGHTPTQDAQVSMYPIPRKQSVVLACLITCLFRTESAALTI